MGPAMAPAQTLMEKLRWRYSRWTPPLLLVALVSVSRRSEQSCCWTHPPVWIRMRPALKMTCGKGIQMVSASPASNDSTGNVEEQGRTDTRADGAEVDEPQAETGNLDTGDTSAAGGVQQAQTEAVSELDASMDPYEASFEADV
mmetsp:Transcript_22454/g.38375  ORF Transcript_22454/g.38375 Transcript_22454/m.38375 type:complete len:144 (-) Transcript_22454:88-519(-)